MRKSFDELTTGDIVWALKVPDKQGKNPKHRPVVIITNTLLKAAPTLVGVAVSGSILGPGEILPDDHVLLDWHSHGHPVTGLNKRVAAICTWFVGVTPETYDKYSGKCHPRKLNLILDHIKRYPARPKVLRRS